MQEPLPISQAGSFRGTHAHRTQALKEVISIFGFSRNPADDGDDGSIAAISREPDNEQYLAAAAKYGKRLGKPLVRNLWIGFSEHSETEAVVCDNSQEDAGTSSGERPALASIRQFGGSGSLAQSQSIPALARNSVQEPLEFVKSSAAVSIIQENFPKLNGPTGQKVVEGAVHKLMHRRRSVPGLGRVSVSAAIVKIDFDSLCRLTSHVMKQQEKSEEGMHLLKIPFHPDGIKAYWDIFILILLIETCFVVPYLLAFDTIAGNVMTPFNKFDVGVDCLFMVDIVVNFMTTYNHQGVEITDLRKIALNYMKTWFAFDLAGSFPLDKVILATAGGNMDLSSLRILKAVRMLKLIRALKLMTIVTALQEREGFAALKPALKIFKSSFVMIFMAHLFGCLFHMLIDNSNTDNWLYHYDPEVFYEDNVSRYLVSIYWATITVSTMGYGDVLPTTHTERIYTACVAVVGTIVFAYGMGNITCLITQGSGSNTRFDHHVLTVTEWMDFRKLPLAAKNLVKQFLFGTLRKSPRVYDESGVLWLLPEQLRHIIYRNISAVHKEREEMPHILEGVCQEAQAALLVATTRLVFQDNSLIWMADQPGSSIVFVTSGIVNIVDRAELKEDRITPLPDASDRNSFHISEGGHFGEACLFPEYGKFRSFTAIADGSVIARELTYNSLLAVSCEFPFLLERFRALSSLRAIREVTHPMMFKTPQLLPKDVLSQDSSLDASVALLSNELRRAKVEQTLHGRHDAASCLPFDAWTDVWLEDSFSDVARGIQTDTRVVYQRSPWPSGSGCNWEIATFVLTGDERLLCVRDCERVLAIDGIATLGKVIDARNNSVRRSSTKDPKDQIYELEIEIEGRSTLVLRLQSRALLNQVWRRLQAILLDIAEVNRDAREEMAENGGAGPKEDCRGIEDVGVEIV
eukprot:CAMPEP_0173423972 /NCGR_PEP_ID=MMETSP1357-20121228/4047_1 /TAXON_ID=77926 /ORGANISM="Hemiselmis rufescens, Strain PCC563" /LENGTH=917 /DNA_ID=CAMNT_0014387139 /DNA_START=137 /DNA_END=2887 /DNA_ORIENTATION=-